MFTCESDCTRDLCFNGRTSQGHSQSRRLHGTSDSISKTVQDNNVVTIQTTNRKWWHGDISDELEWLSNSRTYCGHFRCDFPCSSWQDVNWHSASRGLSVTAELQWLLNLDAAGKQFIKLECGPMPNLVVALPNTGGALCSTPQSFADAPY